MKLVVDSYPHDWTLKLRFMRECGVVSAKWEGEALVACQVDPGHQSPSTPQTTQQEEPKPDAKAVQQRRTLGATPALVVSRADD